MLISIPGRWHVVQRAIDGHIPINKRIQIQWIYGLAVDSPWYSEKVLVIDHMVLGGDIVGEKVADKTDRRGVLLGEPRNWPNCA